MTASKKERVSIELDSELAFHLDELLRGALAAAGHIDPADAKSIREPKATLDIDAKTAAAVSQLLREGLVTASSAHQANNNSVAAAIGKVLQKPQDKD